MKESDKIPEILWNLTEFSWRGDGCIDERERILKISPGFLKMKEGHIWWKEINYWIPFWTCSVWGTCMLLYLILIVLFLKAAGKVHCSKMDKWIMIYKFAGISYSLKPDRRQWSGEMEWKKVGYKKFSNKPGAGCSCL
jgi:hypothetical protein